MREEDFDMVCFHPACIRDKNQLFLSGSSTDPHRQHQSCLIDERSFQFRCLMDNIVHFKQRKQTLIDKIQVEFSHLKMKWGQFLEGQLQNTLKAVNELYKHDHQSISFASYERSLKQKTKHTDLYLGLINWTHHNQGRDASEYIENLPIKCWNKMSKKLEQGLQNMKKQLRHIYDLQNDQFNSQNFESENKLQVAKIQRQFIISKDKKRTKKDEHILKGVALQLIKTPNKLSYKIIDPALKIEFDSLRKHKSFQKFYNIVARTTFNNIQKNMILIFPNQTVKKISQQHKEKIYKTLKEYKLWMSIDETVIFQKCIKSFNYVDESIKIAEYQIYVIYTVLLTKIIETNKEKNIQINYNSEPLNLQKQIQFLVYQYEEFNKVEQILQKRYIYSQNHQLNMQSIFRNFMKQKYEKACLNFRFEINSKILQIINQQSLNERSLTKLAYFMVQFSLRKTKIVDEGDRSNFSSLIDLILLNREERILKDRTSWSNETICEFLRNKSMVKKSIWQISDQQEKIQRLNKKNEIMSQTRVVKLEEPELFSTSDVEIIDE